MTELTLTYPIFVRSEEQQEYYNQIIDKLTRSNGGIDDRDEYAIGMLSVALALVDFCTNDIHENGMMIEVQGDRNVISKQNPSLRLLEQANRDLKFYLKELGLTPTSRTTDNVAIGAIDAFL